MLHRYLLFQISMQSITTQTEIASASSMLMACARLHHFNTRLLHTKFPKRTSSSSSARNNRTISASTSSDDAFFTWDDVFRSAKPHDAPRDSPNSNLHAFFDRIKACNRGSEMRREFITFVVEERIVGYVHNRFAEVLRDFKDVFVLEEDDDDRCVSLCGSLASPEERTDAVGEVIERLGEGVIPVVPSNIIIWGTGIFFIRTCSSSILWDKGPLVMLPKSACWNNDDNKASISKGLVVGATLVLNWFFVLTLTRAYGIHMNGYVDRDGEKFLWIGKRSNKKPTFPGMLDHLVAGGLPHDVTCKENVLKECEEEAGIPRSLAKSAVPVGAVSYIDIDEYKYKRDVLFCYDLKIPDGFVPSNQDGEVDSFKLIPVTDVANIIRRTKLFKPNCSLVIIDFLFRHGFITPEESGYLQLLQSLRSGDCS